MTEKEGTVYEEAFKASEDTVGAAETNTLKLNLGCSDAMAEGFVNVDVVDPCDTKFDLSQDNWPWKDSSVEEIVANDIIEHLPDKIRTMNEIWRVLKNGGTAQIVLPTTDGRGAWQDPQHRSFWNRNSFYYFTVGNPHYERFRKSNGIHGGFRVLKEKQWLAGDDVSKLAILLEAVK